MTTAALLAKSETKTITEIFDCRKMRKEKYYNRDQLSEKLEERDFGCGRPRVLSRRAHPE
jgi:hypothetical protein